MCCELRTELFRVWRTRNYNEPSIIEFFMFKSILLTIILAAIFSTGWIIGRHRLISSGNQNFVQSSDSIEGITLIDRKIADAGQVSTIISFLDSGDTNDAEYLLNLQQSSDVLAINDLLQTAPEQSLHTATNLLRMISKTYVDRLSDYHGSLGNADTNSIKEVQLILAKYKN